MGELEEARAEAATLRDALQAAKADADARFDALKKQQAETKAKAKAILQRQKAEANQRVDNLQGEKDRLAEELRMVKDLLREEGEAGKAVSKHVEELETLVETGKLDLERLLVEKGVVDERVRVLETQVHDVKGSGMNERERLQKRVNDLEDELKCEREKTANGEGYALVPNGQIKMKEQTSDVDAELQEARGQIAQLETTCEQLRNENETLLQKTKSGTATATVDSVADGKSPEEEQSEHMEESIEAGDVIQIKRQEFDEQKSELCRLQKVVSTLQAETGSATASRDVPGEELRVLSKQLENAREELKSAQETHRKAVDELCAEKKEIEETLAKAEESTTKFKSDLEKSELALQQERENVLREKQKTAESSTNDDESKKILEAKVAELERVIASKQADILKVRDKARTYLKDINAEKREMEEKMKREVEALRKELWEEQEKALREQQRAESVSSELDNCLALIREKQKSLQMLKMTISTEKMAAEEARRETHSLQTEFIAYKERARIALQERENAAGALEAAVDAATSSLRAEVEKMRKDNSLLRKRLASVKQSDERMQELLERAEKAEAAVDLLRKDATGVSAANYSQIDVLEEKIASLESEVTKAQASTDDAEARQETTMMRLEAAERALRGAEVRAEEAARLSNKTIEALRKQIEALESALERAEQASAAAQRTAAAAAKALAFTNPEEEEVTTSPRENMDSSPQRRDSISGDISPYDDPTELNAGRTTLAAAMEGHAGSLGIGIRDDSLLLDGNRLAFNADLQARDKQITVLTTQVAELGALLDEAQQEASLKSEQTTLLKAEVKNLDAKLAAAEKLHDGVPFSYLRTIVVRYLETDDPTLLPVVANVLSFTKEEEARVKACRGSSSSTSTLSTNSQRSGYFSMPFLGSR